MNRRKFMLSSALGALAVAAIPQSAVADDLDDELAWTEKHGLRNNMRVDANPLQDTLQKYPNCPYCGMKIAQHTDTMHLLQYDDDRSEATCSLHCAALSLALNMDRGPKNIWVGDAGASAPLPQRPLIKADAAFYVIDRRRPGTMAGADVHAVSNPAQAQMAAATTGGFVVDFDRALRLTFVDMADAVGDIRRRRAERRARRGG